ncbi:MAG: aspartate kinase, partial [Pontimonas sp.]
HEAGRTDISFTLPKEDGARAMEALKSARKDSGFESLLYDDEIGRLSVVGAGMRSNAGVSAQLFTALSGAGVNIEMISTSEIRISVIMRSDILPDAVRAVHSAFGLDGDVDATIYAGTGR